VFRRAPSRSAAGRVVDRRSLLRAGLLAGLGTAAAPLLTACGSDGSLSGAGRRLVVRQALEMSNLDPAFTAGRSDTEIMTCVFEGLQSYRPGTLDLVDTLAEEFEVSDDGTRIRFRVRKGIPFHHGYGEVTAEDVRFSFERIAGVGGFDFDSAYEDDWGALREVRVTGRYTGEINLKHPFAPLFITTVPMDRGYVLSKRAVQDRTEGFGTRPVGTGPYEFVEWKPRVHTLLRRFDDYGGARNTYAGPGVWDEIEIRAVPNDNSASIALTTGELDFGIIAPIDGPSFRADPNFAVTRRSTVDYRFIGMNEAHPKLRDRRVREAVRWAVDVDSILAAAFDNAFDRATAVIPPTMDVGHWPGAPRRKPDPERSRALLREAGATDLSFRLTTSTDQQNADVVCQVVQANLREAGIGCEIEMQDPGTFFTLGGEVQRSRELFYTAFSSFPDPYWSMVWFTCAQVDVWNFQSFCDERFDDLHRRAARSLDPAERDRLYVEMQRRWDEAANTIWVAWPTEIYAGKQGVEACIRPDGRMLPADFRRAAT